jgi:hypothetical protein
MLGSIVIRDVSRRQTVSLPDCGGALFAFSSPTPGSRFLFSLSRQINLEIRFELVSLACGEKLAAEMRSDES